MTAPARLLDLTRLVSRLGRGPLTGVDRVEYAYLRRFLTGEAPLFALVRTRLGFVLLDRAGAQGVADRVDGLPSGQSDLAGKLTRWRDPMRARAEADLRRLAKARCPAVLLRRMLAAHLPAGFVYFNTGHADLSRTNLRAVKAAGGHIAVLVHDTIPLDHPEFTRAGIPAVFGRKIAAVSRYADLVIHTTQDARGKTEAHLAKAGRCPPGVVSPLGVPVPTPVPSELPEGIVSPYVMALGTIEPRKNLGLLLDVWDDAKGALPRLYVVGAAGWAAPALFDRLAAAPGVEVLSGLSDGAVAALMQGAEALVFPSLAEGFGLPPLEAAGLGVPVIASDLASLRELLPEFPVYLDPHDRYRWMETIKALGQVRPIQRRNSGRVNLPTWNAHFNVVLNFESYGRGSVPGPTVEE